MNILVTGATGTVGRHVVQQLIDKGYLFAQYREIRKTHNCPTVQRSFTGI